MHPHPADGKNVFVIIPVHNRREITLGCLGRLKANGDMERAHVIVVDDGSTDGTARAIRENHPEVILLEGDGNLWWAGGILTGMKEAMRRQAEVMVWLNDDSYPRPGAVEALVDHVRQTGAIAVGQSESPIGTRYAGWNKAFWGLRPVQCPDGQIVPCDTFSGNFVAFPKKVVEQIGCVDARHFPHGYADSDYGLRAHYRGFAIHLLGNALADSILSDNPRAASWLLDERPARNILRALLDRTGVFHPRTYWQYHTRHWGARGALVWGATYVKLFAFLAAKAVIPRSWLLRWIGGRSVAWRTRCAATEKVRQP